MAFFVLFLLQRPRTYGIRIFMIIQMNHLVVLISRRNDLDANDPRKQEESKLTLPLQTNDCFFSSGCPHFPCPDRMAEGKYLKTPKCHIKPSTPHFCCYPRITKEKAMKAPNIVLALHSSPLSPTLEARFTPRITRPNSEQGRG